MVFSSSYKSDELRSLIRSFTRAIDPVVAVEIGTQQGSSAINIAKGMKENTCLFTYDLFDEKYASPPYYDTHALKEVAEENIRLQKDIRATVHVKRGSAEDAASEHLQIDLLHIDICNCLENMKPILPLFASKVNRGIILEGGIYNNWQKKHNYNNYKPFLSEPVVSDLWNHITVPHDEHYAVTLLTRK